MDDRSVLDGNGRTTYFVSLASAGFYLCIADDEHHSAMQRAGGFQIRIATDEHHRRG